jgi:hypothetical protein
LDLLQSVFDQGPVIVLFQDLTEVGNGHSAREKVLERLVEQEELEQPNPPSITRAKAGFTAGPFDELYVVKKVTKEASLIVCGRSALFTIRANAPDQSLIEAAQNGIREDVVRQSKPSQSRDGSEGVVRVQC